MKILLDYGHGGTDPGAVAYGRKESEDVLVFGKWLKAYCEKKGMTVYETRTGHEYVSLRQRVAICNRHRVDFVLSIHRNASPFHKGDGAETYVYPNSDAKFLAAKLQREMVRVGFKDRGVKQASYYILKHTKAKAILVEIGFIDAKKDNELFDKCAEKLAEKMANIIMTYK